MKNLFFGLLATVMFSVFSFGQKTDTFTNKKYYEISSIEMSEVRGVKIPINENSTIKSGDLENVVYLKVFDEKIKDFVYFAGKTNGKYAEFLEIIVPENSIYARMAPNVKCPKGYPQCAMDCTDSPTTIGMIVCTGYCMLSCP